MYVPQNKRLLSRNFMLISLQIVFFVDFVMVRKCFFRLFVLFFWMIAFITLLADFLPLIFVCQICLFFLSVCLCCFLLLFRITLLADVLLSVRNYLATDFWIFLEDFVYPRTWLADVLPQPLGSAPADSGSRFLPWTFSFFA